MKTAREHLQKLIECDDLVDLVVVFQRRGKLPEAFHTFDKQAKAIAFVNKALRLSDDDLLKVMRGRQ